MQNKKYLKSSHFFISALAGIGFSNSYRQTFPLDGRLAYYFSDDFGVEFFYSSIFNIPNSTVQALNQAAPNTLPQIREIRTQYGGIFQWVPWYAKINVFNTLLYFDWYFGLGGGSIQTFVDKRSSVSSPTNFVEQNVYAVFFSTGHLFHVSQSFIIRIDLIGSYYQAPISGLTGDTSLYSNYNFVVGAGLKL